MATENVVMAAVLAEGETVIGNAACEPHVQGPLPLPRLARRRIDGIESNYVLRVHGVQGCAAAAGGSRPSTSRSATSSGSRPRPAAI